MTEAFGKTSWQCRVSLARMGIHTDTRLNTMGIGNESGFERSYGVWGKTWFWQGWITELCIHGHALIDLRHPDDAIGKMTRLHQKVLEAFKRAQVDFPDSIPCMAHKPREDGLIGLVENSWETERATQNPRRHWPTEVLAEGIEASTGDETLLRRQLHLSSKGLHVEDALNTYTSPGRMLHDCKDRTWQFKTRIAVREFQDEKISFKPQEFSTRYLEEESASSLSQTAGDILLESFATYAPGGPKHGATGNGLPPGFKTLAEFRAEEEARKEREPIDDEEGLTP